MDDPDGCNHCGGDPANVERVYCYCPAGAEAAGDEA